MVTGFCDHWQYRESKELYLSKNFNPTAIFRKVGVFVIHKNVRVEAIE
jgi:hypothetical protein